MDQIRLKNGRFQEARGGIHVMDRAPLDAFAFTPKGEQSAKADLIWQRVCVEYSPLEKGTVLFLKGRPEDLAMRQRWRGRSGDAGYIATQQRELAETYSWSDDRAYEIDTTGQSVDVVVRRMLRLIHLCEYRHFNFDRRLEEYRSGPEAGGGA
jgi:hypothetical protein